MTKSTPLAQLRRLILAVSLGFVVSLLVAGGVALVLGNSTHDQVSAQLVERHIPFPDKGSKELNALPTTDKAAVAQYAGKMVTTGEQAKVFAENYIKVHQMEATGNKSYAQLDREDPVRLTAQTADTLRGELLSTYAWWTVGSYAIIGGWVLLGLGGAMLVLTLVADRRAPKAPKAL